MFKNFLKSVNIWLSYGQKYRGLFFWLTVYILYIVATETVNLPSKWRLLTEMTVVHNLDDKKLCWQKLLVIQKSYSIFLQLWQ
jgi:hypothetical protein